MEQNGNQNLPPVVLCRAGCGFYGSAAFDGMCSKCYKDALKRKQQNASPVSGRMSPPVSSSSGETESTNNVSSVTSTLAHTSIGNNIILLLSYVCASLLYIVPVTVLSCPCSLICSEPFLRM